MQTNELTHEVGIVRAIKYYQVTIEGLPSARIDDVVLREDGARALVSSLRHDAIDATMLDRVDVAPGQRFILTKQNNQLYIGKHLFGRIVNPMCDSIDGGTLLPPKNTIFNLSTEAGTIERRGKITKQLYTGYVMTDIVLPIGVGQRQLLMGPVQSGASAFAQEVIVNQGGVPNVVCIYVLIGKHSSTIQRIAHAIFETTARNNSLVLATTTRDMAPMHTLVPKVAIQIAEQFASEGSDVLVVLDDMYTHAKYLREIALLEGRLPGRESYPGDIFFQQAHLMERGGCFANQGSITMLPILQTNPEGYNDLITTNIMGTTDGHLLFSPLLYAQGVFPSIVQFESVTRVGKHTQTLVQKQLSEAVSVALSRAKEQERTAQFGQVADSARTVLDTGLTLRSFLSQTQSARLSITTQTMLMALPFTTFQGVHKGVFTQPEIQTLIDVIQAHSSYGIIEKRILESTGLEEFLTVFEKEIVPSCIKICQT